MSYAQARNSEPMQGALTESVRRLTLSAAVAT